MTSFPWSPLIRSLARSKVAAFSSSVRKLCFYIEPLAGNGELFSKKRAEPEELLGSVGQYVHEHDCCLRSSVPG